MRQVRAKANAELREFNGETDHVHLLIHYPPRVNLSTLVGSLKGVSAHYLRKEYADHIRRYLWCSVGAAARWPGAAPTWLSQLRQKEQLCSASNELITSLAPS